jgi:hypothetical protein
MKKVTAVCVAAIVGALAGCQPMEEHDDPYSSTQTARRASTAGQDLLDEMRDQGIWIEDFVWIGGYVACEDCQLVVRTDFSVEGEMTQNIYYHRYKDSPRPRRGERLVCSAHWSIESVDVPGFDPTDRILLSSVLLDNTCGWPNGPFPPSVLARVEDGDDGEPLLVAWWPGSDAETFPGYDFEGTHLKSTPMAFCPESSYISHKRPYCRPSCHLNHLQWCEFPEP